jgi:hypothetical protein
VDSSSALRVVREQSGGSGSLSLREVVQKLKLTFDRPLFMLCRMVVFEGMICVDEWMSVTGT